MDCGTLNERIGSIDLAEALWLSARIAEGIRYGHRHGIAHLDIKPTNILLRNTPEGKWDYPKVSDWGLAKMLLEHSNSIEGISPTYAAPEQFDEDFGSTDDITDIYQLGAVVYALITGKPPFTGSSTSVMQGVLQEDPAPPSEINPEVPAAMDSVVLKALSKQKEDRYDGVLAFRQELDQLLEEYNTDNWETATPPTILSKKEPADPTAGTETNSSENKPAADETELTDTDSQTSSSSVDGNNGIHSSHSSVQRTDNSDSLPVSRRTALGVLGLGILGGGGWMAAEMVGNRAATATTGIANNSQIETPSGTSSQTGNDSQIEESIGSDTQTETSSEPTETILFSDEFDDGEFSDRWEYAEGQDTSAVEVSEDNDILYHRSPSEYGGENTGTILTQDSFNASERVRLSGQIRTLISDYWSFGFGFSFQDNEISLRSQQWEGFDRFAAFGVEDRPDRYASDYDYYGEQTHKAKFAPATTRSELITYTMTVDVDSGQLLRVQRGEETWDVSLDIGNTEGEFSIILGGGNNHEVEFESTELQKVPEDS
jgi:serine/threonine protein kinase